MSNGVLFWPMEPQDTEDNLESYLELESIKLETAKTIAGSERLKLRIESGV